MLCMELFVYSSFYENYFKVRLVLNKTPYRQISAEVKRTCERSKISKDTLCYHRRQETMIVADTRLSKEEKIQAAIDDIDEEDRDHIRVKRTITSLKDYKIN